MTQPRVFSPDPAAPLKLLAACPAYRETPLRQARGGAGNALFIKDETARMGLGSFKALGGVYAVARIIEGAWQSAQGRPLTPAEFLTPGVQALARGMCFVCASAGNHGLSVAAGARIFGARARIHIAATVPEGFARRLADKGADVVRSGRDYEESVAAAIADAAATGAIHLADGSWPGYTRAPSLVMEGYGVMAEELRAQLAKAGTWPETVYLQAGVGGMAASVASVIRRSWPHQPRIVIAEPSEAPCLAASAAAGAPVTVKGAVSNMGRLDCKAPSVLAVEALAMLDVHYAQVTDREASDAVAALGAQGIATTPSGAAGFAALQGAPRPGPALVVITEGVA